MNPTHPASSQPPSNHSKKNSPSILGGGATIGTAQAAHGTFVRGWIFVTVCPVR
jgi:hypothetical protein